MTVGVKVVGRTANAVALAREIESGSFGDEPFHVINGYLLAGRRLLELAVVDRQVRRDGIDLLNTDGANGTVGTLCQNCKTGGKG